MDTDEGKRMGNMAEVFGNGKFSAEWRFDKIKEMVEAESWEDDYENKGSQLRTVMLGSIFTITPSGKMYAPFACSNVAGCAGCNGTGHVKSRYKRRVLKKWAARQKARAKWVAQYGYANEWPAHILAKSAKLNSLNLRDNPCCTRCGGMGSAEAHDDEQWRQEMEAALEEVGLSLHYYDDSIFAAEYRETPENEDDCDEEAE